MNSAGVRIGRPQPPCGLQLVAECQVSGIAQPRYYIRMLVHIRVDSAAPQGNLVTGEKFLQVLYSLPAGNDAGNLQFGRRTLGKESLLGKFHAFARSKHRVNQ